MEVSESLNIKRNKSFIFKNLNLSIPDIKNKDNENLSSNYKTIQSDSTTADDKNEINDIKRGTYKTDVTFQKININNIDNLFNEKNLKDTSKKSKKSIKNVNIQPKKLNLEENEEELLKVNNKNQIRKGDLIKNVKIKKNVLLKEFPPENNQLYNYKYELTNNNIIIPKLPNVFINHLILKNSINVYMNKSANYIPLSITKRIKSKNLTILYYLPLKKI